MSSVPGSGFESRQHIRNHVLVLILERGKKKKGGKLSSKEEEPIHRETQAKKKTAENKARPENNKNLARN